MIELADGLMRGEDGRIRCWWPGADAMYVTYHDTEWGQPTTTDQRLFEKLCLEGFQAGLSWITILRKRDAFREVFHDFDAETVAGMDESDVLRLLDDARIIRHRGKIEATINNAGRLLELLTSDDVTSFTEWIWSWAPAGHTQPTSNADVPATTDVSKALSKDLKKRGWRFVGPTTAYAFMQSEGLVNDHIQGCEFA